MTSAFDGLAHELTDEERAESTTGHYVALCGAEVRPTAGTDPIGRAFARPAGDGLAALVDVCRSLRVKLPALVDICRDLGRRRELPPRRCR